MLGITVQAQTAVQHVPQWNALQSTIAHALSPNPNGHQEDSFGASTYSITPMSSPCIWSTSRADEQWSLGFCPGLPKSRIGQSTCLPEKGGAVLVHQGCYRLMLVISIWSSTKPQNPQFVYVYQRQMVYLPGLSLISKQQGEIILIEGGFHLTQTNLPWIALAK